jgi:hypothetical protein
LRKNQQIQLEEYKLNRPKKASGFGKMSIEKLRSRINKIDDELLSLLNERAKVVIEMPRFIRRSASARYSTGF